MSSLAPTFLASLRAVGTAATMAFAGFYLHRRGFATPSGKKMMALLSQQVTIPAFLFAKIIYCPSGGSGGGSSSMQNLDPSLNNDAPEIVCPSVADRISDLWMLLLWPVYVVLCGIFTGYLAARLSKTQPSQINSCLAACAFGNSTGLPITLLSVIHKQFPKSTELGRIDPTAFLSVYLLLYPVLQWGVGGWLLAPEEDGKKHGISGGNTNVQSVENGGIAEASPLLPHNQQANGNAHNQHRYLHISHILNQQPLETPTMAAGQEEFGSTLSMMVKELSFTSLGHLNQGGSYEELEMDGDDGPLTIDAAVEAKSAASSFIAGINPPTIHEHVEFTNGHKDTDMNNDAMLPRAPSHQQLQSMQDADVPPLTETLFRIACKVFQAPVICSILGLFIASFPNLRGLLENIWGDETRTAPLKWLFDGIYSVGQAAVPINMTILGINLSSTFQKKNKKLDYDNDKEKMLPNQTMMAVVIGKMFIMPVIGILSTWFLQRYYIDFPDEIDATCYLVMMIVFITPTANNVMVMVELSGSSSKEGMARLIGWQYAVSPVVLSIVLSAVVSLASCHFDQSPVCST